MFRKQKLQRALMSVKVTCSVMYIAVRAGDAELCWTVRFTSHVPPSHRSQTSKFVESEPAECHEASDGLEQLAVNSCRTFTVTVPQ